MLAFLAVIAFALIAREHDDPTSAASTEDRRYGFVMTTDRTLIVAAANLLT